ncbi:MAG: tRNA lysidine(34) synthetase TilS [Mycoplasmatota bacterium]|nr:tRNA lysidine(34) synthetase TilS [Mycoplasmatota bacterium]
MVSIDKKFSFLINDTIVVGCSSGPDSMALVDMLLKIREKYQLQLIIAHVNHNVRSESYEEEKYLKEYCENNKLVFESMIIDNYGDDNFHNEARNIRYNFFESLVYKYNAKYLMTAHHGDDLIETILMRIVRGSNLSGYSGFKKIVPMNGYTIVRPLIDYTKSELEEYVKINNVKYYIDSSNDKDKYTRNRYRKNVIPFLKEEDSNVHHKFLKFSEELDAANKFIIKTRDRAIKRCLKKNILLLDEFVLEDRFIQKEILYYMLSEFYQDDLILVGDKHIDLLFDLVYSKKANSFVNLPNEVVANKSYNMLELKRETLEITSYEIEFDNYVLLPDKHAIERIDDTDDNSNSICRLNSKEISLPLIVRTRRVGDKMKVKGLNGSKKVKDIFIDKKVGLGKRDSWPVVVDSRGVIVWIPGIKKSSFDKKKVDSYDIVLKYS